MIGKCCVSTTITLAGMNFEVCFLLGKGVMISITQFLTTQQLGGASPTNPPRQLLTSFHALSNVVGTNLQVASSQKKMSSRNEGQKKVHDWHINGGKRGAKFGRLVKLLLGLLLFEEMSSKKHATKPGNFTHQATSKERGSIGLQGTSWKQPWKVLRKRKGRWQI